MLLRKPNGWTTAPPGPIVGLDPQPFLSHDGASMMAPQAVLQADLLRRIQTECLEMSDLRLTPAQAQRLWGLDPATCAAVLKTLVDKKFLVRTSDGAFVLFEPAAHR